MKRPERFATALARLAVVALFALSAGACTTIAANPDESLIERIQKATTSADHLGLAAQYDREATAARQKATEHRQMQEIYRGRVGVGRGGVELQASILRHCMNLVAQYERAALEYEGLASLHRRLADESKK